MKARIYQPAKTSMQSGRSKMKRWVLEFPRSSAVKPDVLMGWQSSSDTQRQVRMYFATKEEAIAFADAKGLAYDMREPQRRNLRMKTYADNFAYDRKGAWTH